MICTTTMALTLFRFERVMEYYRDITALTVSLEGVKSIGSLIDSMVREFHTNELNVHCCRTRFVTFRYIRIGNTCIFVTQFRARLNPRLSQNSLARISATKYSHEIWLNLNSDEELEESRIRVCVPF